MGPCLCEQQARDQETGQNEEDVHAHVPARQEPHAGMAEHDQEHRRSAEPLNVATIGVRRSWCGPCGHTDTVGATANRSPTGR